MLKKSFSLSHIYYINAVSFRYRKSKEMELKMELLQILINERNFAWQKIVAETAESFTAMNSLQSSGFLLTLGQNLKEELEERCSLYRNHACKPGNTIAFEAFFDSTEKGLRTCIRSRFGVEVPAKDECQNLKQKYLIIISAEPQKKNQKVIGFHAEVN